VASRRKEKPKRSRTNGCRHAARRKRKTVLLVDFFFVVRSRDDSANSTARLIAQLNDAPREIATLRAANAS